MTAISVIGGMAFSLAFAILVEEFIFGQVLVVVFARQTVRVESRQPHQTTKETVCCS